MYHYQRVLLAEARRFGEESNPSHSREIVLSEGVREIATAARDLVNGRMGLKDFLLRVVPMGVQKSRMGEMANKITATLSEPEERVGRDRKREIIILTVLAYIAML